jgi:hypothetical protein
MSAACLLERFLEDQGDGSISAKPCAYPPPDELAVFDYELVKQHIREQYYDTQLTKEQKRHQMIRDRKVRAPIRRISINITHSHAPAGIVAAFMR